MAQKRKILAQYSTVSAVYVVNGLKHILDI